MYYLSAYAIAVAHGFRGSEEKWLASLRGAPGKSAYEVAVECGYQGTKEEWLETLKGQSDLPVAAAAAPTGYDTYAAAGDNLPVVEKATQQQEAVGVGKQIVFLPSRANLTTAPVLKLNNGETVEVRLRADGETADTVPVPVGALKAGVPVTLTFGGTYWLVDSAIGGLGGGDAERVELTQPVTIGETECDNVQEALEAAAAELGYKVDKDDVNEVEFVTASDAVANVTNDEAPITPAGVKAIVDEYGGDAQNIKVFDLDDVSYAALFAATEDAKTAIFLAYNVANYEEAENVFPYESKLLLLPIVGFTAGVGATFEQDADLVTYTAETPPVAVTVRKTVRVTVQSGASAGDPDVKNVEIVPTEIDRICPEPIVLTPSSNFQYSAEVWSKTKNYTAGDYFFDNKNGSAGVIGIPHIYVCVNSFTGDGTPLSTRTSAGDVNDLGEMLSLPSGLTSMTQYAASISRGTLKILLGNMLIHQFQIAAGVVSFNGLIAGAARTFTISYDTSTGAISKINYATAAL